jgi:hypothetical protein
MYRVARNTIGPVYYLKNNKGSSLPFIYSFIMYFVLYPKNLPSINIPITIVKTKPTTKVLQTIAHQNITLVIVHVSYASLFEICQ